ncbi:FtsX-like permease family protein [Actinomadura sp. J1-007]|uniref:FtsX-like permease family protein n=1 Tax=Actinomadura sp. J1-007 TaxID=2661913 RepID=UPI0013260AD2|nr:FtsX-like permease family protein [Actinomadura sp. J1-007]MWK37361.1 FtsX-like permease family protein [Actinomadura sp. J1-007]
MTGGVLAAKFRRDLRHRPAQLVAVVALVMLGVALFGASYDAYKNLDGGYRALFDRYRFADITLAGGDAEAIAREAARTGGVAAAATRTVADVPLRMPDGATMVGRVVGMPAGTQPAVDRVKLRDGAYLDASAPDGVLAEKHIADHAHLRPGSKVQVWRDGAWHGVAVRGTATSPEYLWPARDRQEPLPAPGSFGVLFAPEPLARRIAASASVQGPNQVVVHYTRDGREDAARLDAALTATARRYGAPDAVTRADQPSNAALGEDIKGFSELAYLFPALFLMAAGVAIYVVLTRRVARDRSLIGMLRANGFPRRTVLAHYLATGVVVGLAGAAPGVLLGLALAGTVTRAYTGAIGIPDAQVSVRAGTVLTGVAFALAAGVLAALAPAVAAARVPPAEAMRGAVPSGRGGRGVLARVERLLPVTRRLPAGAWLVLRGPARQPRRTSYTALGVVLALVLILVSWGMLDTSKATVARQFDRIQRQDAELTLAPGTGSGSVPRSGSGSGSGSGSVPVPSVLADLARQPGVSAAEPSANVPVSLEAGGRAYSTALVGLRRDTSMHRFLTSAGARPLPARGLLLGSAMRDRLGLKAGDRLTVRPSTPAGPRAGRRRGSRWPGSWTSRSARSRTPRSGRPRRSRPASARRPCSCGSRTAPTGTRWNGPSRPVRAWSPTPTRGRSSGP